MSQNSGLYPALRRSEGLGVSAAMGLSGNHSLPSGRCLPAQTPREDIEAPGADEVPGGVPQLGTT